MRDFIGVDVTLSNKDTNYTLNISWGLGGGRGGLWTFQFQKSFVFTIAIPGVSCLKGVEIQHKCDRFKTIVFKKENVIVKEKMLFAQLTMVIHEKIFLR